MHKYRTFISFCRLNLADLRAIQIKGSQQLFTVQEVLGPLSYAECMGRNIET